MLIYIVAVNGDIVPENIKTELQSWIDKCEELEYELDVADEAIKVLEKENDRLIKENTELEKAMYELAKEIFKLNKSW